MIINDRAGVGLTAVALPAKGGTVTNVDLQAIAPRDDIPALVAEVARLRERVAELEDANRWRPYPKVAPEIHKELLITYFPGHADGLRVARTATWNGVDWLVGGWALRPELVIAWRQLPEPWRGEVQE